VAQRGTSATVTNAADYFLMDRYKHYRNSGGTLTAEQSTEAPAGFSHSYKLTATSGVTASAAQLNFFQQQIEGNACYHLNLGTSDAVEFTVSFWVRSSVTGTYSIAVGNSATNRSLVKTYSIDSANTWEYKTLTIQGDTSGSWLGGTNTGLRLWFNLGSGSNYEATEDVWNSSLELKTSGTADWFSNTGATWQITGVQLEVGSVATPFEHRSYGEELALCQRYFYRKTFVNGYPALSGGSSDGGSAFFNIYFPVSMRASAAGATSSPSFVTAVPAGNQISLYSNGRLAISSVAFSSLTQNMAIFKTVSSPLTTGYAATLDTGSSVYFDFNAEL
jgi:hypothetical protein